MDWNELAKEVHANAVAHGFWEGERPLYEVVDLVHSELSEAVEELRNGSPDEYYGENGKPEGWYYECCDAAIRLLDWLGHRGADATPQIVKRTPMARLETIVRAHEHVTNMWSWRHDENAMERGAQLALGDIKAMFANEGKDMMAFIRAKMEFNKTRPAKHGKKF